MIFSQPKRFLSAVAVVAIGFCAGPAEAKKTAFIFVNWGAPAFVSEAKSVSAQLKRFGWEVLLFDNVEATDGLTISQKVDGKTVTYTCVKGQMCGWQKIITTFVPTDSVKAGDQILIDIQGDGSTNIPNSLKLADGTATGISGLQLDMDSLLSYEEFATNFHYQAGSADTWASHSVEAYFANMTKTVTGSDYLLASYGVYYNNMISSGDAFILARDYGAHGAKVAVLDHSCQGGSTVKLLETLKNSNICAISTTGIDSPGIQGTPALSKFLSTTKPADKPALDLYATYITGEFATGTGMHRAGNRIHQSGFEASCTSTMGVRETSDNATGAFTTWWDWNRGRVSHVVREPSRYTVVGSASNDRIWTEAALSKSFTDDCKSAGKNCHLTSDPRLRIADGWVRWFGETLKSFQAMHPVSGDLNRVVADGNALIEKIKAYKVSLLQNCRHFSSRRPVDKLSYPQGV